MKNTPQLAALAFLGLPIVAAYAAEKPTTQPTEALPEITVKGKRISLTTPAIEAIREEIQQTPGGVSVVDAETYKRGRATTMKDALDYTPGVLVQSRFGAEEARLSIRGSGIQRTFHGRGLKLLQDGVPLNLADGGFDFQAVDPLVASRIEVLRGANALELGGTTLGGAINFVAPTGYDAPALTTRLEYGSFGSIRAQLATAGVQGALDYYASFSHFSQDGFRDHSKQDNQRFFLNLGYRLSPTLETRFYVTYAKTNSELPGNLTKQQLEDNPEQAQRNAFFKPSDYIDSNWERNYKLFRLAHKTTWQEDDQRLSLSTFWSNKDLDHPILFVIDQLSNDFGASLRYDNTGDVLGHRNRLTIGASPTWGVVEDNRFNNVLGKRGPAGAPLFPDPDSHQTSQNYDLYAQNQFWVTRKVALSIGSQLTYAIRDNRDDSRGLRTDSQSWWGFSPKLGLLVQATPETQFFANVSRSFEPPSFGELTPNSAAAGSRGLINLDAQTATTIEVGTRGRDGRFAWDLAYYYAWLDNELLQFQVAPGLNQTINAGRTIHQGVEAGLDIDVIRGVWSKSGTLVKSDGKKTIAPSNTPGDRVVLHSTYLWNDFRYQNDSTFGNGLLAGIPEHYLRAELMYEHPCGFYVGPNIESVPKGYRVDAKATLFTDAYTLLGAKIGWRNTRGLSVYLEAKNLTDKHYAATTGVVQNATGSPAQFLPGEGRSIFAGVEYRW
jgi:iron complex outermembrane receptor protein